MAITVDIDKNSGFCAGVIKAIGVAEDYLGSAAEGSKLYSLGAIVHNESELARLSAKGLLTLGYDEFDSLRDATGKTLLIRAHGEPPRVYYKAKGLGFRIIDCTCPVVLALQKSIRDAYARLHEGGAKGQIVIFGKIGHAEVLGLVGQVDGDAVVVDGIEMLEQAVADGRIDLYLPTEVFSQTTKGPAEYAQVCSRLEEMMARKWELSVERFKGKGILIVHKSICSQVATRHIKLSQFASGHDVIVFVSGQESSNGRILCELCASLNPRTHHIASESELDPSWFGADDSVGICGATSTPKWLLEKVAGKIMDYNIIK